MAILRLGAFLKRKKRARGGYLHVRVGEL